MRSMVRFAATFLLTLILLSCSDRDKGAGNVPSVTWQTAIGTGIDERGTRVILLPDGGFLVAGMAANFARTDNDLYLVRTDYNGTMLWDRRLVSPRRDELRDAAISSDGRLLLAGWVDMNDASGTNALLVQADMEGQTVRTRHFERQFRGAFNDEGRVVIPTQDGGGFIVGITERADTSLECLLVRFDSTGEVLAQHVFGDSQGENVQAALLAPDQTILIAGAAGDTNQGRTDAMLTCVDTEGQVIWRKTYPSAGSSRLNALALDAGGDILIAGSADTTGNGNLDIFLARVDPLGQIIWATIRGGNWNDLATAVVVTLDGGVVIAGTTGSFGAQATDACLMKFDAAGTFLWQQLHGEQSFDEASDVVEAADSGFIVAGTTRSIGSGGMDVFLIKTDAEGNAPDPEVIP